MNVNALVSDWPWLWAVARLVIAECKSRDATWHLHGQRGNSACVVQVP